MTNEEWDRKAEFLLNQQAKFDAGMQELKQEIKEAQKINEQKLAEAAATAAHAAETASHSTEAVLHVAGSVTKLAETVTNLTTMTYDGFRFVFDSMKHTNDKVDVLVNSQIRTDEKLRDTDERQRNIEKRQQDLAGIFERYIRKDQQGLNSA